MVEIFLKKGLKQPFFKFQIYRKGFFHTVCLPSKNSPKSVAEICNIFFAKNGYFKPFFANPSTNTQNNEIFSKIFQNPSIRILNGGIRILNGGIRILNGGIRIFVGGKKIVNFL